MLSSLRKSLHLLPFILFPLLGFSQATIRLNDHWLFIKDSLNQCAGVFKASQHQQNVSLPHTWNAFDVMDDEPGYYRGAGWYKRTLHVQKEWRNKELFLYFEGANQYAEVFVNGEKAGEHIGGYTAFEVPISRYLNFEEPDSNEILVRVDNSFNENIPPLTADFTFFGGLYRNVSLLVKKNVHFSGGDDGASGVFVLTPKVGADVANAVIRGTIANASGKQQKLLLETRIFDQNHHLVAVSLQDIKLKADVKETFRQDMDPINHPTLWSPESPYLYSIQARIINKRSKEVLDEVNQPLGFRFFSFDPDRGFFLNGAPLKLIGASRHQDFEGMGNAVPDSLQVEDLVKLKAMGANFLRVAHYPQSPAILNACDSLGLLASVEIPIVNEITESQKFYDNSLQMQKEMIRQNYNHPSVIIWAYMNEVLLRPHFQDDKVRQQTYFENTCRLAQKLEDLTRKEDSSRYTMIANHGNVKGYMQAGLTRIPMLVGWNLYQGWYGGKIADFGPQLDEIHRLIPDKPLLVTEYGADADPRINSDQPKRFDKSIEYAVDYHVGYIQDILKRPFVAGAAAWNLADFNSETREESMPHINNKGLLTWDREPKNTYFLYQANFLKRPFIKIGLQDGQNLAGKAKEASAISNKRIQVFSNADQVELIVNHQSLGKKASGQFLTGWDVPFINGQNSLKAISYINGQVMTDSLKIDFKVLPAPLKNAHLPFIDLNISLGDQRFFTDADGRIWVPDQEYVEGSWGHIGGQAYVMEGAKRQPFGTDKNIRGTFDDPIYQTQQTGIKSYRLDVPDGLYQVTLHFAELTGAKATSLVYNLDNGGKAEAQQQRKFSVSINGKAVLSGLDLAKSAGILTAVKKTFETEAKDGKGISILFQAEEGESVLNALEVKKVH